METMKNDMGGAAAVRGRDDAVPVLAPRMEVTAYIPMTDNMLGGDAMRAGDVLTARNGKTMEVLNTDAEGRLILADALSLAVEDEPDAILDAATLTGACMVALGDKMAGVMGSSDELRQRVVDAAEAEGELVWPLPLPEHLRPLHRQRHRRSPQHRHQALRRCADGRAVPEGVRGRRAVGAPRHRRSGVRLGAVGRGAQGRHRLRRADARRRAGPLVEAPRLIASGASRAPPPSRW
jgi:hypothetical protein